MMYEKWASQLWASKDREAELPEVIRRFLGLGALLFIS